MCTICQIHLNVLPNLTLPSNPLEKATLPPIIRMGEARLRDIKSITEIMQVADRAEVQSPSVWPEVDRLSTSCSCLVHVDSSTRNCGSGRDCGNSPSVFSSIDGKTPWPTGFFFLILNFNLLCHSVRVAEKRSNRGLPLQRYRSAWCYHHICANYWYVM